MCQLHLVILKLLSFVSEIEARVFGGDDATATIGGCAACERADGPQTAVNMRRISLAAPVRRLPVWLTRATMLGSSSFSAVRGCNPNTPLACRWG